MEGQNKGDSKPKKNKDEPKIKESDAQKANDVLSIEELKKQISQLKETNKGLEKTIQQQKSKINELREKNWKARDELAGAKAEKKTCRTRDTSRLRRTSSKSSVKIVITEKELRLERKVEDLKREIVDLKTESRAAVAAAVNEQERLQEMVKELSAVQQQNGKLKDEIEAKNPVNFALSWCKRVSRHFTMTKILYSFLTMQY